MPNEQPPGSGEFEWSFKPGRVEQALIENNQKIDRIINLVRLKIQEPSNTINEQTYKKLIEEIVSLNNEIERLSGFAGQILLYENNLLRAINLLSRGKLDPNIINSSEGNAALEVVRRLIGGDVLEFNSQMESLLTPDIKRAIVEERVLRFESGLSMESLLDLVDSYNRR